MPRVVITEGAARGLECCRRFLVENNPQASMRAGQAIAQQFALLETEPEIGRPFDGLPELRELIVPLEVLVMWRFIITKQKPIRCMCLPSGTRKRRAIKKSKLFDQWTKSH